MKTGSPNQVVFEDATATDRSEPAVKVTDDVVPFDEPNPVKTRALGKRHGRVDRIGLAIARDKCTTKNLVLVEQWVKRLGFGGVYHAGFDAEDLAE